MLVVVDRNATCLSRFLSVRRLGPLIFRYVIINCSNYCFHYAVYTYNHHHCFSLLTNFKKEEVLNLISIFYIPFPLVVLLIGISGRLSDFYCAVCCGLGIPHGTTPHDLQMIVLNLASISYLFVLSLGTRETFITWLLF